MYTTNPIKFKWILFLIIAIAFKHAIAQDLTLLTYSLSPELSHFDRFINKKTNTPVSKIKYYQNRKYSWDKKHYLSSSPHGNFVILHEFGGKIIKKIYGVSLGDQIIWSDNYIIFDRFYNEPNKKVLFNLLSGEIKAYNTKGKIRFIGQNNSKSFFVTIEDSLIISRGSVVSINENGMEIEFYNPTVAGRVWGKPPLKNYEEWIPTFSVTSISFCYYNKQLSVGSQKIGNKESKAFYKNYEKILNNFEDIGYFGVEDVFFNNGKTYVLYSDMYLYQFNEDGFQKIINCEQLYMNSFIVIDGYLIFSRNIEDSENTSDDNLVGILSLKSQDIVFPKLIIK